jgi:hypothetical protein
VTNQICVEATPALGMIVSVVGAMVFVFTFELAKVGLRRLLNAVMEK